MSVLELAGYLQAAVGEQARLAAVHASSFVVGSRAARWSCVEGTDAYDDLLTALGVGP